ncbi:transcriptional regulator [Yersinia massiliensis]|nr:transcriptional regulator [Yersinia massiliensis]
MLGARGMPQFNIRTPENIRESIRDLAASHGRSMNSEIIQALQEYIARNSEAPTTCNSQGFDLSHPA